MDRDLRNEGWGPEDCYPDGAYEAEERRKKIEWWKRSAAAEQSAGVTGYAKRGRSMKWISVDDGYLPPPGMEVLAYRPDALLDHNDKPLIICHRKPNGKWSGCHKVTHWLEMDMPPGWTSDMEKRQHA